MDEGWIVIARKASEHPCLKAFDARGVWEKLLLLAVYRPHRTRLGGQFVELKRGQCAVSLSSLAEEGGISRKRMRTIMALFARSGMAEMVPAKGQAFTIVTICNYALYQDRWEREGQGQGPVGAKLGPTEERETKEQRTRESESDSLPEESPHDAAPRARRARSGNSYSAEFEVVWTTYPRREEDDKAGCYSLWRTAARTSDATAIIASARAWSAEQAANPYRIGLRRWLKDKHYLRPPPVYRPNEGERSDVIGEAEAAFRNINRKMNGHDYGQEFSGAHSVVPDRPPPGVWDWLEDDDGAPDVADCALRRSLTGPVAGNA